MNWSGRQHPVETVIEFIAPIPPAVAAGWAGLRMGLSTVEAVALAVLVLTCAFAAIRAIGPTKAAGSYGFEPAAFEELDAVPGELLLEAKDEVLLLDDPLVEPADDARVVRLFARQEPTPGELVERIEDFLGEAHRTIPPAIDEPPADASAALQAALANIRASLR